MIIYSAVFINRDDIESQKYFRLAKVWEYSAKKYNPSAKVILEVIERDPSIDLSDNGFKLGYWNKVVQESKEAVILMDSDIVVIGNMSEAFNTPFDFAYTVRGGPNTPYPFNGGVIFTRPTIQTKSFFEKWHRTDKIMYLDPEFHNRFKAIYSGMNQASLGCLLEQEAKNKTLEIERLPCYLYNAANAVWHLTNENTKAIHFNAQLRKQLFNTLAGRKHISNPANVIKKLKTVQELKCESHCKTWIKLENEMKEKLKR